MQGTNVNPYAVRQQFPALLHNDMIYIPDLNRPIDYEVTGYLLQTLVTGSDRLTISRCRPV